MPTATASDRDQLLDLNRDYIRSVQHSDVRRFDEILADDFLCSNPDASLVDRKAFLTQEDGERMDTDDVVEVGKRALDIVNGQTLFA